jgi:transcription-repair coupling factor (superfamily II helicase)
MIQRLVHNAELETGHGQMEGRNWKNDVGTSMNGGDVLVATTIMKD